MSKRLANPITLCWLVVMCIAGSACTGTTSAPSTSIPGQVSDSNHPLEPDSTATAAFVPSPSPSPVEAPKPVAAVTVDELRLKLARGDSLVLLDVRPQTLFDMGHIEAAISMPLEQLADRYLEIPQGIDVIVYPECA